MKGRRTLAITTFCVFVPLEGILSFHAGNGKLVRYFSRTTHWLFLVVCAYMLVYMHVSMYSADAMPSSVVPPQLLHICLNVMSLLQRLVANSWLEFTAGHCEAPQRHSRNLYIANVSYNGPDKTSTTRSCSQRVTEARMWSQACMHSAGECKCIDGRSAMLQYWSLRCVEMHPAAVFSCSSRQGLCLASSA